MEGRQFYTDPSRALDKWSLPDAETFRVRRGDNIESEEGGYLACGWYWQACIPGCIPDSDPVGPFRTEAAAIKDAQDYC